MVENKVIRKNGVFRHYLNRYYKNQIHKFFGISFIEFMNLEIDRVDQMLELTMEWIKEELNYGKKEEEELGRTMKENQYHQPTDYQ